MQLRSKEPVTLAAIEWGERCVLSSQQADTARACSCQDRNVSILRCVIPYRPCNGLLRTFITSLLFKIHPTFFLNDYALYIAYVVH